MRIKCSYWNTEDIFLAQMLIFQSNVYPLSHKYSGKLFMRDNIVHLTCGLTTSSKPK